VTALPAGVGVAADAGLRAHMEDRWAVRAAPGGLFAAVYDGHGGAAVADHAAAELHLAAIRALQAGLDAAAALERAFAEVAQATADAESGSTAAAFWLAGATLTTAHVGDSRVVRVGRTDVDALTRDHRIDAPDERARVLSMGASLDPPYVVRGGHGLMMTRSFGDRWFRPVGVLAEPEIGRHAVRAGDVAVVAATDGLWDVLGLDETARVVRAGATAAAAARALVEAALERGATDNVTAVVVRLAALDRP
jgi:serine/threonine protein phosphatase PrpC